MREIAEYCAERGIGTHLDGARLFMMSAATGVSPSEYAALFDTAYVSLYKYFGAPFGAVLAGTEDFCRELYHDRRMFGGRAFERGAGGGSGAARDGRVRGAIRGGDAEGGGAVRGVERTRGPIGEGLQARLEHIPAQAWRGRGYRSRFIRELSERLVFVSADEYDRNESPSDGEYDDIAADERRDSKRI